MTTSSHFRISPDLSLDPRQNYTRWLISVNERAVLKSTTSIVLRNLLTPQAEWLVANPANPSRIPTAPAELGNNPNAGAIAQWKHATDVANAAIILSNDLKTDIILSLGESIDRETSVGTTGHTTQAIHELLALIKTAYGTLDTSDIVMLESQLTINPAISFRANVANFVSIFTQLGTLNMYTSEYSKMAALESACATMSTAALVLSYKNDFPTLGDRSFTAMAAYMEARVPNLTASAAGYAGKAEAAYADLAARYTALESRLATQEANAAAVSTKAKAPHPGGRGGRGRGHQHGRGGRGAGPQQPRPYCFVHGSKGHKGTDCTIMLNDASYTAAMKEAAHPQTIDGYQGHA